MKIQYRMSDEDEIKVRDVTPQELEEYKLLAKDWVISDFKILDDENKVYEVFYRVNGETIFHVSGQKKNIERVASFIIGSLEDEAREYTLTKNFCCVIIDQHNKDVANGAYDEGEGLDNIFKFDSEI